MLVGGCVSASSPKPRLPSPGQRLRRTRRCRLQRLTPRQRPRLLTLLSRYHLLRPEYRVVASRITWPKQYVSTLENESPASLLTVLLLQGDTCLSILSMMTYISQTQFFAWNPALNGNCNGLWSGYYYCVANFNSASPPPMPTVTTKPTSVAGGSTDSCTSWYNTTVGDTCDRIALQFGTFSASDFIGWNPIVGSDCSNRT